MATTTISSIQFKRGTKANLEAKLVEGVLGIPLKGEPIFETDTQKLKIGDGISTYADLPYIGRDGGSGTTLIADGKSIKITNEVISLFGYSDAANGTVVRKTADGVEWVEVCTLAEVEELLATKQDKISETNKLDYSLIANTPDIPTVPTNVSAFTNDAGYVTNEYHDSTKQDTISDLETIRSGAALGATALQSVPEEYAKKTDIPTVPTKISAFENDEGYLKEHQSLEAYSTTEEMNTAIAAHHDSTKQDVIEDLDDIKTGAALGKTALQEVPDAYAKKTDLPTKTSDLTNDSGFLTEHQSLADYSTTAQMNQAIADHHDDTKQAKLTAGANIYIDENNVISATGGEGGKTYVSGNGIIVNNTNNTISADTTVLSTKDDLSSKQDTIEDLSTIRSGAEAGATAVQPRDLTEYAKKTDLPVVPTKISAFENDEGYLTKHQDISGKANVGDSYTKDESDDKYQVKGDYATTAELNAKQDTITEENKLSYNLLKDTPEIPSVEGFATKDYVDTETAKKQDKLDAYIKTAAVDGNKLTLTKQDDTTVEFTGNNDTYSLVKDTESGDYAAVYHLTKNNENIGVAINIPKDMVVESGTVKTCTEADKPVEGYKVGDKYIDLVIANKTSSHLYILVSDLIDVYEAGNGIKIDGQTISVDTDTIATKASVEAKQDKIDDLATIRSGAALGATALQSFTEEDPTVPSYVKAITEENITSWTNKSDFSGSYNDLTDKPTIPSIEGLATETYVNTEVAKKQDIIDEEHKLDYNLIDNTPTIPSLDGYATEEYVNNHHDSTKQDSINDLDTIKSGAALGATAVQPAALEEYAKKSELPTVPTKVGELTNDKEYQTAAEVSAALAEYAKSEDVAKKQDKLTAGSNITITKNTETGETVISAIGGEGTKEYTAGSGISISGNTISLIQKYVDYLEKQTYVKPTISTFSMTGAGAYETTQSVKVSTFKHKETNIDNISTLAFYKGNTKVADVTPNTSDTTISFDEQTITSDTYFYLKGTDTQSNALSSTVSFTFNTYAYTKVTTAEDVPTSSLTKQSTISSFASSGADITYTKGDYIYFYTTKQNAILETYVSGSWAGVDKVSYEDPVEITLACGNKKNYYVYRIQLTKGSGTAKYRVR